MRIVRTPLRVVVQFCYSKTIDVRQQTCEPVGIDLGVSKQAMHRLTSELVKRHKHFVVEDLAYQNMTRSAKGDAENPGRHVALQVGVEPLNPRSVLGLLRAIAHLQFDQCRWLGGTGGTAQHVEALFKVWLEASGHHPKDQDL